MSIFDSERNRNGMTGALDGVLPEGVRQHIRVSLPDLQVPHVSNGSLHLMYNVPLKFSSAEMMTGNLLHPAEGTNFFRWHLPTLIRN